MTFVTLKTAESPRAFAFNSRDRALKSRSSGLENIFCGRLPSIEAKSMSREYSLLAQN